MTRSPREQQQLEGEPATLLAQGLAALRAGDCAVAAATLRCAVAADPLSADARHGLAVALLQAGQAGAALPHHRRAALLAPGNAAAWAALGRGPRMKGGRACAKG